MSRTSSVEHYRNREAQERIYAERAENPAVKDLHRQFAERYAALATAMEPRRPAN